MLLQRVYKQKSDLEICLMVRMRLTNVKSVSAL
jgi:hypothetical protein